MTTTSAFGTAAPLGSVIVPVMEAVSCAQAAALNASAKHTVRNSLQLDFMVKFFFSRFAASLTPTVSLLKRMNSAFIDYLMSSEKSGARP
jgi:hypothetical protein